MRSKNRTPVQYHSWIVFLPTLLMLLNLSANRAVAQEWINYTNGSDIKALQADGALLWVGTTGGLVSINLTTGEKQFFTKGNSGLPSVRITSLKKAGDGALWVGTEDGLSKLQNNTWTVYRTNNSWLPSNTIQAVAVDDSGVLWVGTENGLARFDGTSWSVFNSSNSPLITNSVSSLAVDELGNLWVGTLPYFHLYREIGGGLFRYDGQSWSQHTDGLPSTKISGIAIDDSGKVWITTRPNYDHWGEIGGGIAVLNGDRWVVFNTSNSGLPSNRVSSIAKGENNTVWFATNYGLVKYDGQWTTYRDEQAGWQGNYTNSIAVTHDGTVWAGTQAGLFRSADHLRQLEQTSNSGLPDNRTRSVAIDSGGNVWVDTFGGIAQLTQTGWKYYDPPDRVLRGDFGYTLALFDNELWVGTYGLGVYRFNGERWLHYDQYNSGLPHGSISSLVRDKEGVIWIGTHSYGLARFDGEHWDVFSASNSGLPSNSLRSLAIDQNNHLWIGTNEGLVYFDGTKWEVYDSSNSGLPANSVNAVVIDSRGDIWIGTSNRGIAQFDGTQWLIHNQLSGLPSNYIRSIALDSRQNIWASMYVAPFYGGFVARLENAHWKSFTPENSGISSGTVVSIVPGNRGDVWFATWPGGLVQYLPQDPVSVDDAPNPAFPNEFRLLQNYPNPFNPSTEIRYQISEVSRVTLKVYDVLGRDVATLVNGEQAGGTHRVRWDAAGLPSGVYVYRLKANEFVGTKKMLLVR